MPSKFCASSAAACIRGNCAPSTSRRFGEAFHSRRAVIPRPRSGARNDSAGQGGPSQQPARGKLKKRAPVLLSAGPVELPLRGGDAGGQAEAPAVVAAAVGGPLKDVDVVGLRGSKSLRDDVTYQRQADRGKRPLPRLRAR